MGKAKVGPKTWIFPMPSSIIGAMVEGKPNFMAAAWCNIASHQPPSVVVSLSKRHHTMKGIEESKGFSLNIPSTNLAKKVDYCGIHSGKRRDKSEIFTVFFGDLETAPLVEECPINFECRLMDIFLVGAQNLVIGEIMETHVNEEVLVDGKVDMKALDPLIYIAGVQEYWGLGEKKAKAFKVGKEL